MVKIIYNPDIHNRKTIRLKGFDYSVQGMYFITICVQNRECVYGNIEKGKPCLNQAGEMVEQHWLKIEQQFENVKLDEYVIMPNHIHGIIFIASAQNNRADTRPAPTIGDIICAFKSMTTNCYIQNVKQNEWKPFDKRLWQRNYFERIIRNQEELDRIRDYIKNNPSRWEFDKNNLDDESGYLNGS